MEESKPIEAEVPVLKLKKLAVRDLEEPISGAIQPEVSTIMGCNLTHETCIHHCNR